MTQQNKKSEDRWCKGDGSWCGSIQCPQLVLKLSPSAIRKKNEFLKEKIIGL